MYTGMDSTAFGARFPSEERVTVHTPSPPRDTTVVMVMTRQIYFRSCSTDVYPCAEYRTEGYASSAASNACKTPDAKPQVCQQLLKGRFIHVNIIQPIKRKTALQFEMTENEFKDSLQCSKGGREACTALDVKPIVIRNRMLCLCTD